MKDPAVLFYTSDFLTGCTSLTMEERGQYITLLCLQHQLGNLSEKTIRLSLGNVSVDVLEKFKIDENGNYYNERMNIEIEKRSNFIDTRRSNGAKGGRPKSEENKPNGLPNAKANDKPNENLIENENINENKDIIKNEFENFRKLYPGTKKGLNTEFDTLKKHKDYKECINLLLPALKKEIEYKQTKKNKGEFVPEWKNLQTWINQRCWEQEFEVIKQIEEQKPKSKNIPLDIIMLYEKTHKDSWDLMKIKEYENSLQGN